MKDDELISRMLQRHPHFQDWAAGLHRGQVELTTVQFAVVDACWSGRRRCGLDDLYMRLQMEIAIRVSRDGRSLRIPTLREFTRVTRLYLPLVFNVPWQSFERPARRGRLSGRSGQTT